MVLTTETARQLPLGIDDPLVLEGLSVPYAEAQIPGGLTLTWGRSGHCSGSVWYRMAENGRSLFFSGDYYDCARVHARDPIEARISPCWIAITACSPVRPRATRRWTR